MWLAQCLLEQKIQPYANSAILNVFFNYSPIQIDPIHSNEGIWSSHNKQLHGISELPNCTISQAHSSVQVLKQTRIPTSTSKVIPYDSIQYSTAFIVLWGHSLPEVYKMYFWGEKIHEHYSYWFVKKSKKHSKQKSEQAAEQHVDRNPTCVSVSG